jgi:acetyl esterase/lipase
LYFLAGSTEMLLDDSVRASDRARQAGVDARIDVWVDLPHVFPLFGFLPEARAALDRITDFIRERADASGNRVTSDGPLTMAAADSLVMTGAATP